MAIVVSPPTPFSPNSLDLASPTRWTTLFPLLRPSFKQIQTPKNQTILLDASKTSTPGLKIAFITQPSHFSSQLLDNNKTVTAIAAAPTEPRDVAAAMRTAGVSEDAGIRIVRVGAKNTVRSLEANVTEVEVAGEMEADHLLQLLGLATERQQAAEIVKAWLEGLETVGMVFSAEKVEGGPAVIRADGTEGFTRARDVVLKDLEGLMAKMGGKGEVTYSVHVSDVNGLSRLENYILAKTVGEFFESKKLPFSLSHSTVLDHDDSARGFGISIAPIPSQFLAPQKLPTPYQQPSTKDAASQATPSTLSSSKISFNDTTVRKSIEAGCNALIKEEPIITEYDTVVGDGDCGYTLRDGAKQVLSFISGKDLSQLPSTVAALVHDLEVNMGGTSGALYCIFLTALSASLASASSVPEALQGALDTMCRYTKARVGDRTMMDALIPFVETLAQSGDVGAALGRAEKGVEGTKRMEAKLGRSTYLDESATQGVPDPGAYGLLVLLRGMGEGAMS